MELRSKIIEIYCESNDLAARYANAIKENFPLLSVSTTTIKQGKFEGFSVITVTGTSSEDTEIMLFWLAQHDI